MNFALIHDNCAINSYYVNDKTAYACGQSEKKRYTYHHSISSECFTAMQNLPFIFDEGCFLNWIEWDELPDLNFDLIFVAIEKNWNTDGSIRNKNQNVSYLRKKYKNAKIVGWIKEIWVGEHDKYDDPRHIRRIEFLNECDAVVTSGISTFKKLDVFNNLSTHVNKKFNFISQPVNTNYLFDNFYSNEKSECIFAYLPNPMHRRGKTYEFANYIRKKYDIEVREKFVNVGQRFDHLSLKEFIDLWSPCAFHFNLDPTDYYPGNQCMQVAAVGSINIGGNNEAHKILFPDTATCDEKILEEKFIDYLENPKSRFNAIEYSWNKLNEIFSFKAVEKQIMELEY